MAHSHVSVLVLAGGKGHRFWPLSREDLPKQFLTLSGGQSMLEQTYQRARLLSPVERIWIVTLSAFSSIIPRLVKEIPAENIVYEPIGRGTAACIALASLQLSRSNREGIIVTLPSDHSVEGQEEFTGTVNKAIAVAEARDVLVTIGSRPSRPDPAYGYMRVNHYIDEAMDNPVAVISRFIEKPSRKEARKLIAQGDHLWNTGILVARVSTLLDAYERFAPDLLSSMRQALAAHTPGVGGAGLEDAYRRLPEIPIEKCILEKSDNVMSVVASFGWDDLGSFSAARRSSERDRHGNVASGLTKMISTRDSTVIGTRPGKLIATFGVSNLLVVDTDDVLLVTTRSRAADLRKLISTLEESGLKDYLRSRKQT